MTCLIGSTFVLCGLRYSPTQVETLYRDLSMTLEDSTTYQLILNRGLTQGVAQGAVEEARRLLLRIAARWHGAAPAAAEAAVRQVADRDRLERMVDRAPDAAGWDDLLATP